MAPTCVPGGWQLPADDTHTLPVTIKFQQRNLLQLVLVPMAHSLWVILRIGTALVTQGFADGTVGDAQLLCEHLQHHQPAVGWTHEIQFGTLGKELGRLVDLHNLACTTSIGGWVLVFCHSTKLIM